MNRHKHASSNMSDVHDIVKTHSRLVNASRGSLVDMNTQYSPLQALTYTLKLIMKITYRNFIHYFALFMYQWLLVSGILYVPCFTPCQYALSETIMPFIVSLFHFMDFYLLVKTYKDKRMSLICNAWHARFHTTNIKLRS